MVTTGIRIGCSSSTPDRGVVIPMKNNRTLPFVLLLICAMLNGCSRTQTTVPTESAEASSQGDKLKELEEGDARVKASFSHLSDVLRQVTTESTLTLYEGLPHQHFYKKEMIDELIGKECRRRRGSFFYKHPNQVTGDDAGHLREIVVDQDSFQIWGGPKGCGGFHPDFSLLWTTGNGMVEFHICFGCHECQLFFNDTHVYCEIADDGYSRLKKILELYHDQLPDLG